MKRTSQSRVMARRVILLGLALALLTACSDGKGKPSLDPSQNFHDALKAASGPFQDLNLTRDEIPPMLKEIAKNPYAQPEPMQCATVKIELTQLDSILGPDMQISEETLTFVADNSDEGVVSSVKELPNLPSVPTLVNKGAGAAHDGVMGFIHKQTEILPFRSIIRKITGADRHEARLKLAYQAGQLRRAYLKGLAEARFGTQCLTPPVVLEVNAAPAT